MRGGIVLDASALIALMFREPGADRVMPHLSHASLSCVNLIETATYCLRQGASAVEAGRMIAALQLQVIPLDETQAYLAASFITHTQPYGLSLSDRACLALAKSRNLPVLTADRIWAKLDLGVEVQVIR